MEVNFIRGNTGEEGDISGPLAYKYTQPQNLAQTLNPKPQTPEPCNISLNRSVGPDATSVTQVISTKQAAQMQTRVYL